MPDGKQTYFSLINVQFYILPVIFIPNSTLHISVSVLCTHGLSLHLVCTSGNAAEMDYDNEIPQFPEQSQKPDCLLPARRNPDDPSSGYSRPILCSEPCPSLPHIDWGLSPLQNDSHQSVSYETASMDRPVAGDFLEQVKNNQSVNTVAGNDGQKMSQYSWFTVYTIEGTFLRLYFGCQP